MKKIAGAFLISVLATPSFAANSLSQNEFGLEFYKRLRETYPDKTNLMISPLSAYLALSLVYNGADKATKTEIASVLRAKGVSVDALNQANKKWMAGLTAKREGIELEIANALFANRGFTFKSDFAKTMRQSYQALIETKDFSDPKTSVFMDEWVNKKTHGKIDKISDILTPRLRVVLMNATYFKGTWQKPFPEPNTRPRDFTKHDGSRADVPMMQNSDTFRYFKDSAYEAIELPYGQGSASLLAFLPSKGANLRHFEKQLTAQKLQAMMKSLAGAQAAKGNVAFPKWKSASSVEIDKVLAAMGMKTAFTNSANFGKMSAESLAIDSAIQKTFIEVNEKTTEAAAVTAFGVRGGAAPQIAFDVTFDRPFFYAIVDNQTQSLLFLGSFSDPK